MPYLGLVVLFENMPIYIFTYICTYMYIYIYIYMHIFNRIHIGGFLFGFGRIIREYAYIHIHIYMYIYVYVYLYIYIYIYIYICTYLTVYIQVVPYLGLVALFENLVKIRVDAYALVAVSRRPHVGIAEGIIYCIYVYIYIYFYIHIYIYIYCISLLESYSLFVYIHIYDIYLYTIYIYIYFAIDVGGWATLMDLMTILGNSMLIFIIFAIFLSFAFMPIALLVLRICL
jgi:hypothetical protein